MMIQDFLLMLLALMAAFNLLIGFKHGVMRLFWSMALEGEATRKQSPAIFWLYASLNAVLMIGALSLLMRALL